MTTAAVENMWRRVLTEYGLPSDGAAVAETDCMWKEMLMEEGLPLDQVYQRLDKGIVPLRIPSIREDEKWVYDQKRKLGDAVYKEMMRKRGERFYKYAVTRDEMKKKLKKAGKEMKLLVEQEALGVFFDNNKKKKKSSEWFTRYNKAAAKKRKNLEEDQEALGLSFDKKKKKKKNNKRKHHGDDENHKKKKMKKATTSSSSSSSS